MKAAVRVGAAATSLPAAGSAARARVRARTSRPTWTTRSRSRSFCFGGRRWRRTVVAQPPRLCADHPRDWDADELRHHGGLQLELRGRVRPGALDVDVAAFLALAIA